MKNVRFFAQSDDSGGIKFSKSLVDIFSGRLTIDGYLNLENLDLDLVFGYNNFSLSDMVSYLNKYNNIQDINFRGAGSCVGTLKTNIASKDTIFNMMEASGSYIAKFIQINNFGIDNYLSAITVKDYNAKTRLEYDTYYAPLKGISEIDECAGDIKIENGILTLKDSKFRTVTSKGTINGDVDLKDLTIVDKLKIDFEQLANQNVRLNMNLEGNILSPKRSLNLEEIKIMLEKR